MREVCFKKLGQKVRERVTAILIGGETDTKWKTIMVSSRYIVLSDMQFPAFSSQILSCSLQIHEKGKCLAFSSWQHTREDIIHLLYTCQSCQPLLAHRGFSKHISQSCQGHINDTADLVLALNPDDRRHCAVHQAKPRASIYLYQTWPIQRLHTVDQSQGPMHTLLQYFPETCCNILIIRLRSLPEPARVSALLTTCPIHLVCNTLFPRKEGLVNLPICCAHVAFWVLKKALSPRIHKILGSCFPWVPVSGYEVLIKPLTPQKSCIFHYTIANAYSGLLAEIPEGPSMPLVNPGGTGYVWGS